MFWAVCSVHRNPPVCPAPTQSDSKVATQVPLESFSNLSLNTNDLGAYKHGGPASVGLGGPRVHTSNMVPEDINVADPWAILWVTGLVWTPDKTETINFPLEHLDLGKRDSLLSGMVSNVEKSINSEAAGWPFLLHGLRKKENWEAQKNQQVWKMRDTEGLRRSCSF